MINTLQKFVQVSNEELLYEPLYLVRLVIFIHRVFTMISFPNEPFHEPGMKRSMLCSFPPMVCQSMALC